MSDCLSISMAEPDMQVANTAGAAVEGGEGGDQAQAMPSVFETLKSVARLIDMEGALP